MRIRLLAIKPAALLACAVVSHAAAETAFVHDATFLPWAPYDNHRLESVHFVDDAFWLLADGRTYRSTDGLAWAPAPEKQRVFAGTKVGPLWFAEERGDIFASADRISWRRINAPGVPHGYGDGTFALLLPRTAEGQRPIAMAPEDALNSWDVRETNIDVVNDVVALDYIGDRWVLVLSGREAKTSADGVTWANFDWPLEEWEAESYETLLGEGHILLIAEAQTIDGDWGGIAVHSDDLETWTVSPLEYPSVDLPDGVPYHWAWTRRIERVDETIFLTLRFTYYAHFYHPKFGLTPSHSYRQVTTKDFATFDIGPSRSSPENLPVEELFRVAENAADPPVRLELVAKDASSPAAYSLHRTESGDTQRVDLPSRPGPARSFVISAAALGGRTFVATANTVYVSPDNGETWETSLSLGGSPSDFIRLSPVHVISGFFSITAWNDSVWAAARDNGEGKAAIWAFSESTGDWSPVREMPPEACRFFDRVGGFLVVAGVRDGETVLEWTSDGETWESHAIDVELPYIRVRKVGDEYYLVGSDFQRDSLARTRLKRSADLRDWETLLTEEDVNVPLRDVAAVRGILLVTRASVTSQDLDLSSEYLTSSDGTDWQMRQHSRLRGLLTPLPDGSVVDAGGMRTWDGVRWFSDHDIVRPYFVEVERGQSTGLPFAGLSFFHFEIDDESVLTIRQPRVLGTDSAGQPTYYFHSSATTIDCFIPAGERTWAFSPHEHTALDNAADTVWGLFHHIGGRWHRHDGFGYLYAPENRPGSYWYWSPDDGWLWIDHRLAHFYFVAEENEWGFLFP